MAPVPPTAPLAPVLTHDSRYYFQEGNIVIRVEDVLFRVHSSILIQDSSIFESMISLPQLDIGASSAEGASDKNPIVLDGETVVRLRALLWALYALPHEIAQLYTPEADIDLLVNIASMAHKYTFEKVESWAADLVMAKIQSPAEHRIPAGYDFFPMMRYTGLSRKFALRQRILDIFRKSFTCDTTDFARIIRFVHEDSDGSWDDLLGLTLYQYVIRGPQRWEADGDKLPRDKRVLLYIAFGNLCEMRMLGVPWEHIPNCANTGKCIGEFQERLKCSSCVSGYKGAQGDFVAWTNRVALVHPPNGTSCLDAGMRAMQAQARKLEEHAWMFFSELKC